jgi:predicted enzyme related to lactoylglutathione lyase
MKTSSCIRRRIGLAIAAAVLVTIVAVPAAGQTAPPVAGEFLGADLITEDAATATAFYSELFGWGVEKVEDGEYALTHQGRLIASVSTIERDADVSRTFWLVGLAVDDLDASLQAATKKGAQMYEQIRTVPDYGRLAVIGDPEKAPIMLIEPGAKRIGGTTGPGSWVWVELWTDDPEAAAAFYGDVIGYGTKTIDRNGNPYGLFTGSGKNLAGLLKIPNEFENVNPGWAPYVGVSDLQQAMARVKDLGGRVVLGVEESSGALVSLILDPVGGAIFLYEIGTYDGER